MAYERKYFGDFSLKSRFSTFRANIGETMKFNDTKLSPACSIDNSLDDGVHCELYAPLLSLRITRDAKRSCLPPGVSTGRPLWAWGVHCCF